VDFLWLLQKILSHNFERLKAALHFPTAASFAFHDMCRCDDRDGRTRLWGWIHLHQTAVTQPEYGCVFLAAFFARTLDDGIEGACRRVTALNWKAKYSRPPR
jgi:hypothetical protein